MTNPNCRLLAHARTIVLLALLALFSGCVTETQVRQIVDNANYQALVAATPGSEAGGIPANGQTDKSAEDAAARINAFLESHPNDTAMTGALRLRQALLYLNQRSFSLAQTAIGQVPKSSLLSPRDQAILDAFPDLLWWSQYALMTNQEEFYANHRTEATDCMRSLQTRAEALSHLPDLQDYLLEMRAWIALKLALAQRDEGFLAATIVDAVNTWTANFSDAELAMPPANTPGAKLLDLSTRRVARLRAFLAEAAIQNAGITSVSQLKFKAPAVSAYWAGLPH